MDFDLPAELDLALCSMCSKNSYSWGHILPKSFSKRVDKQILLGDEQVANVWIEEYDYMIRKLSYWSKGRRVLVKSPGDTVTCSVILLLKTSFIDKNAFLWLFLQSVLSAMLAYLGREYVREGRRIGIVALSVSIV